MGNFIADWDDPMDWVDNPAYQAFQSVGPMLRSFDMFSLCCFAWCPIPVPMPNIERLALEYDFEEFSGASPELLLPRLVALVNSAGDRLKVIVITISVHSQNLPDIAVHLPKLRCPALEAIELDGQAFTVLAPAMAEVACKKLSVALCRKQDWRSLRDLVQKALPSLQKLHLDALLAGMTWEEVGEDFAAIKSIAQNRRIALSVAFSTSYRGSTGPDLLAVTRGMAGELQSMYIRIGLGLFDPFSAYRERSVINLAGLTHLDISMIDKLAEVPRGARGDSFVSLIRQIQAPALRFATVCIDTPFLHPYIAFTEALEAGAFPILEAIRGVLSINTEGARWDDVAWQVIRQDFKAVCARRGISLRSMIWKNGEPLGAG